ncbi:MAG: DUF1449 family protein, partial [Cohaesibacteraceae bacterium]|nr:DUF1449 family protein [Cohaesibacteraceae bacterium]
MLDFILHPNNLVFSGALVFVLFIGLAEVLGAGGLFSESDVDVDMDVDVDLDLDLVSVAAGDTAGSEGFSFSPFSWLNVGRLPLLIFLVVALSSFGIVGLVGQ